MFAVHTLEKSEHSLTFLKMAAFVLVCLEVAALRVRANDYFCRLFLIFDPYFLR